MCQVLLSLSFLHACLLDIYPAFVIRSHYYTSPSNTAFDCIYSYPILAINADFSPIGPLSHRNPPSFFASGDLFECDGVHRIFSM